MQWEPFGILAQQGAVKDMRGFIYTLDEALTDAMTWSHSHTSEYHINHPHSPLSPPSMLQDFQSPLALPHLQSLYISLAHPVAPPALQIPSLQGFLPATPHLRGIPAGSH